MIVFVGVVVIRWEFAIVGIIVVVIIGVAAINITGLVANPNANNQNQSSQPQQNTSVQNPSVENNQTAPIPPITGQATNKTMTNAMNRTTTSGGGAGGGSGSGSGGGTTQTPACPTCPGPSAWSLCQDGQQTRTNYNCNSTTSYQCQQYTEPQGCTIDVNVYVSPSTVNTNNNNDFTVNVMINSTKDVYAAQFNLYFDNNILDVLNVIEGDFLKSDGAETFPTFEINNTSGKILVGVTRITSQTGVTGQGMLATITFHAKNAGTSALDLTEVLVSDPDLSALSVNAMGGSATVS